MNGMYIYLPLELHYFNDNMHKNNIHFSVSSLINIKICNEISFIEYQLIELFKSNYNIIKPAIYALSEILKSGNIRIFQKSKNKKNNIGINMQPITQPNIIVKISGIWETQHYIGITYKFIIS
jgi:hypothetical protein